jgi:hypothetical protein
MAAFRELLSRLGYTDVVTLLNSGNAVFGAPAGTPQKHAANVAAALSSELSIEVPVIVKSAPELAAIVAENPIAAEPSAHSRLLVAFTQDQGALATLAAVGALVTPPGAVRDRPARGVPLLRRGHSSEQGGRGAAGKGRQGCHDEEPRDDTQAPCSCEQGRRLTPAAIATRRKSGTSSAIRTTLPLLHHPEFSSQRVISSAAPSSDTTSMRFSVTRAAMSTRSYLAHATRCRVRKSTRETR